MKILTGPFLLIVCYLVICNFAIIAYSFSHTSSDESKVTGSESSDHNEHCKAWLVQSIPTDMPQLSRVPGVLSTGKFIIYLGLVFHACYLFALMPESKRRKIVEEDRIKFDLFKHFSSLFPAMTTVTLPHALFFIFY